MAFRPHKFGRYIIVDPIAVGGMAEIYRARLAASKEGPDRVIVIKKVIANLSQNSEFTQMFEEEIKITVGLAHPNIIQIYDYGKVDDQYFMAMEYVEGKNLRQFVKRLADMKSMFSIDMSAYIISQVCHALSHAHNYKDRMTGKGLGIVHRDISPQNVMISYDGAVKLFDFGIAKARSASEATRAGVIKGKPSYLSPEQINGEDLDGRCDIFALGIVLWELLTAKRLFVAESDMGVLRLIQSAKIEPPSTFNPAVPQALDAIALKALTRDKSKRYQAAEEFQRDLHKFLYSFNASFNPADLSYYAQELFKSEIREDRERLSKSLSIEPVDDNASPDPNETKKSVSTKLAEGLVSAAEFQREVMDSGASTENVSLSQPSDLQLASTANMRQPKSGPALPGSSFTSNSSLKSASVPPAKSGDNMVIPPWSKAGGEGASGSRPRAAARTATALRKAVDETESSSSGRYLFVVVLLVAGGFLAARQTGMLKGTPLHMFSPNEADRVANSSGNKNATRTPTSNEATAKSVIPAAAKSTGTIELKTGLVTDYQVLVNGVPTAVSNNQISVPLHEKLNIEVTRPGYQSHLIEMTLNSATPQSVRLDFISVPSGSVYLVTTPSVKASFYLGSKLVFSGNTPVEQTLPAGNYRLVMENNLLNLRAEQQIQIEEGKRQTLEKVLK